MLEAAAETGTVKAFVYTSSAPIIAGVGGAYDHADETHPTLAVTRKGDPYHLAKALGDRLTLEANGKNGGFSFFAFLKRSLGEDSQYGTSVKGSRDILLGISVW